MTQDATPVGRLIADIRARAQRGVLTDLERAAFIAGRTERTWPKPLCFIAGVIVGFALCEFLSGQILLGRP